MIANLHAVLKESSIIKGIPYSGNMFPERAALLK